MMEIIVSRACGLIVPANSEFNAWFDTIQVTQGCGFLPFYESGAGDPEDDNFKLSDKYSLPVFMCDSNSALHVMKSDTPTRKTKHYDLRWHAVKDWSCNFCFIDSENQLADPMTKPMVSQWKYLCLFIHPLGGQEIKTKSKKGKTESETETEIENELDNLSDYESDNEDVNAALTFCFTSTTVEKWKSKKSKSKSKDTR